VAGDALKNERWSVVVEGNCISISTCRFRVVVSKKYYDELLEREERDHPNIKILDDNGQESFPQSHPKQWELFIRKHMCSAILELFLVLLFCETISGEMSQRCREISMATSYKKLWK
jgi:hypothetical protein